MHMADALLSPAVGGAMLVAAAGAITCCSAKVKKGLDDRKVPLMGVLGAFLFAAQMINFSIPATGSSGHLGGGLLLAVLLGPHAAFLTIASVLMIQALFFADGGLLALGCNIINLGLFPAFVAYPLVYRPLVANSASRARSVSAALAAAIVALQLGAFAVVVETTLSGIASLPFRPFLSVMQPIHLAIGLVEGIVTGAIIGFVRKARPDIFYGSDSIGNGLRNGVLPAFLALALITGGFVSWFASERPDGLEWSISKVSGRELTEGKDRIHALLSDLQEKAAFLPGYGFRSSEGERGRVGRSIAGCVGAVIALGLAWGVGYLLRRRQQLAAMKPHTHEHSHPHRHSHEHPHRHGELLHSHEHHHAHSHPHPQVHHHQRPHPADPNPRHSHDTVVAEHDHTHGDEEHGSHDHCH